MTKLPASAPADLGRVLRALKKTYGEPEIPEPRDPFAAIVWENAAYLVDDAKRALVFERLREAVGLSPAAILAAAPGAVEAAIARDGGMQPSNRAGKVVRCAEIAMAHAGGDLLGTLKTLDPKAAQRLLRRFPGVGEPGAAKLMLLAGLSDRPALDSNGLRVLTRLGAIPEAGSYAATYRLAIGFLERSGAAKPGQALAVYALLRTHGKELCKRSATRCAACPLTGSCPKKGISSSAGASWPRKL